MFISATTFMISFFGKAIARLKLNVCELGIKTRRKGLFRTYNYNSKKRRKYFGY